MAKSGSGPEVIICKSRVAKNKIEDPAQKDDDEDEISVRNFNINKARYEIMRFALSGFSKEQQMKEKISMAIKLGAKPPKKEYKNYKELIQERKAKKQLEKQELKEKAKKINQHKLQVIGRKKKQKLRKKRA